MCQCSKSEVIKKNFLLISAEHEILNAHQFKNIKKGHYKTSILNWPQNLAIFYFFHKEVKVCPLQRFIIELFGNKLF